MKEVAAEIEGLDERALAALLSGAVLAVSGEEIALDDVVVSRTPRPGVVVAAAERLAVALDTAVTPELAREGLAREVVKVVQARRRSAGLEVADRITLTWASDDQAVEAAFSAHGDWIAAEVLAVEVRRVATGSGKPEDVDGHAVWIEIERR